MGESVCVSASGMFAALSQCKSLSESELLGCQMYVPGSALMCSLEPVAVVDEKNETR